MYGGGAGAVGYHQAGVGLGGAVSMYGGLGSAGQGGQGVGGAIGQGGHAMGGGYGMGGGGPHDGLQGQQQSELRMLGRE